MSYRNPVAYCVWVSLMLLSVSLGFAELRSGQIPPPVVGSDFYHNGHFSNAQVELGRLLFFDKILSGNRNIACATCHHPRHGTSDAVPLSFGEGAVGVGTQRRVTRDNPVLGRVPRNSQALYFKGAKAFTRLFHDGRLEPDPHRNWTSGFWSPAREQLPDGLDNVLAAQAMFPVLSPIEMAGHKGENKIATAVALDQLSGPDGAWTLLAQRLQAIPGYVERFRAAFDDIDAAEQITFVHAANAIAAFETVAFRADDSPFDRYLRTRDTRHLSPAAQRGMALFYGRADCATCHRGKFQTDHQFHAIAMPQLGPGKGDGWDQSYWRETGWMARLEDYGRYRVTQKAQDKYRFRTPTLRNVELTGPWGHAGSYTALKDVVQHHLDPVNALRAYPVKTSGLAPLSHIVEPTASGSQLAFQPLNPRRLDDFLRRDTWVMQTPTLRDAIAQANKLDPISLSDADINHLVEFLNALTDPRSRDQSDLIPAQVPSGLPVDP